MARRGDDRHKGFVVGPNQGARGEYWVVRVKDPESQYNGMKISVASVHGGITLARGLNVDFLVGSTDDKSGEMSLRAVDVRLVVTR